MLSKTFSKKISTFLLLLLLGIPSLLSQEPYTIYNKAEKTAHDLGIDPFYFVHQTFADSFYMTDLYQYLDYDDMTHILKQVYHGINSEEPLRVYYTLQQPEDARIGYIIMNHKEEGEMLVMMTNFNKELRQFEPKPDPNDQLARWYFLRGDKLVYRKDLYSEDAEGEARNGDVGDLIEFYLFDDNAENDAQIKPLLDELLATHTDDFNQYVLHLYASHYYLWQGDLDAAKKAIETMKQLFETGEGIPSNYKLLLSMGTTQYEIMKRWMAD